MIFYDSVSRFPQRKILEGAPNETGVKQALSVRYILPLTTTEKYATDSPRNLLGQL